MSASASETPPPPPSDMTKRLRDYLTREGGGVLTRKDLQGTFMQHNVLKPERKRIDIVSHKLLCDQLYFGTRTNFVQ